MYGMCYAVQRTQADAEARGDKKTVFSIMAVIVVWQGVSVELYVVG